MNKSTVQVLILTFFIFVIFGDLFFSWMNSTKPLQLQLVEAIFAFLSGVLAWKYLFKENKVQ